MGTVSDGAEASDRTHITESKQLWVAQNDLREPQMKLGAKSSSLQHWLQLTYELELHNYNAKKTIAEQQLQAAEEGCEKFSNRAGNFMDAFTGGGSTDDVDSQILKAKSEIPAIKRTSKRQKELIYYKIDMSRWMLEQRLLSTESTFRKALQSGKFYEDFVKDFNGIAEEDCIVQTPVLYNKDILKQPSRKTYLRINKIYSPSALSWYPSAENLILAVGGSSGNFGLWNIKYF